MDNQNGTSMDPITITLDPDALDFGVEYSLDGEPIGRRSFSDAVLECAARLLLADVNREQRAEMRKSVAAEVNRQIVAAVGPMIEAALTEPFRTTNSYGEHVGAETTLREIVVKEATGYLSKKAGSGYDGPTVLGKLVKDEVEKAIRGELKEALDVERTAAAAALRDAASKMLSDTIVKAAKAVAS